MSMPIDELIPAKKAAEFTKMFEAEIQKVVFGSGMDAARAGHEYIQDIDKLFVEDANKGFILGLLYGYHAGYLWEKEHHDR
jgi:hypothetical protein